MKSSLLILLILSAACVARGPTQNQNDEGVVQNATPILESKPETETIPAPRPEEVAETEDTETPTPIKVTELEESLREFMSDGPKFKDAQEFDRFLWKKLSADAESDYVRGCRKRASKNPFCYSVNRIRTIREYLEDRVKVPPPAPPKSIQALVPIWKEGTVANWKELRKAKVPNLLQGLLGFPSELIRGLAERALSEKKCPNQIAVAVAATLEDNLPSDIPLPLLADLYEKGAKCGSTTAVDREHYRTRAGLLYYWAKDYAKAAELLSRVNPQDAYNGRALYWLFRSQQNLGHEAKAERTLKRLKVRHPFSFHALVAGAADNQDLGEKYFQNVKSERKRARGNSGLNRIIEQAEALNHYGFQRTSAILIDWALDRYHRIDPEIRIYLAELGDPYIRVTTLPGLMMTRPSLVTRRTLQLSYPKPYFEIFSRYNGNVDVYLMLSIARKESQFNPLAISPANAQGLLQLNPETAAKLTQGNPGNILDIETNIKLAGRYLGNLVSEFKGYHLAIAAYNAGERPVENWMKRFPVTDPILFIDLIPFRETRDYVGYVLSNLYWYHRVQDEKALDIFKKFLAFQSEP